MIRADIVPSDGVSVVNGAVEVLDSDEGGVGNFIFELIETAFENMVKAIEDFVGEGDEDNLELVSAPEVENLFEISPASAVSDDFAEIFIETPAQAKILDEFLTYTSKLDAIIENKPATACNFDERQVFSMSYVKNSAQTQIYSAKSEGAIEKWQEC